MKVNKLTRILRAVPKGLGDENLTISLAHSKDNFYISISTHTSEKFEFDHGGYQRTCQLTEDDLEKDSKDLVKDLVNIYNELLYPKGTVQDVTE